MKTTQHSLDFVPRTKLRLAEVERLIRQHRIMVPPPSRRTLVQMCDSGVFRTAPRERPRSPYLVYEDSFLDWVKEMDGKLD